MRSLLNKFHLILFLFLCLRTGHLHAQTKEEVNRLMDSIVKELKIAKQDTTRCILINKMGEIIYVAKPDSAFEHWGKAREIALRNLKNEAIDAKSRQCFLNQLGISENNRGYIYQNRGNHLKATECYEESLRIWKEIKASTTQIASVLNNLGLMYKNFGDIAKALSYYSEALKIFEKDGNKTHTAYLMNNIGMIYNSQGDVGKALEYFKSCLEVQKSTGNKKGMSVASLNIGSIYKRLKENEKALECYNESYRLSKDLNDVAGVAVALNNIGQFLMEQEKYKEAFVYMEECLSLAEKSGDKKTLVTAINNLCEFYYKTGDLKRSLDQSLRGMKLAQELGYPAFVQTFATQLKLIYQKENQFQKALEMAELEVKMKDSLSNENTRKASLKSQLKYEYEKKAAADSVSHAKESEIKNVELAKQKAEIRAKKNQQYALFGGLGLVCLFGVFMFNRYKVTQKQKSIIEEQKEVVEEQKKLVEVKQKELLDSIRYAKRIQQAQMPSDKRVESLITSLKKNQ